MTDSDAALTFPKDFTPDPAGGLQIWHAHKTVYVNHGGWLTGPVRIGDGWSVQLPNGERIDGPRDLAPGERLA